MPAKYFCDLCDGELKDEDQFSISTALARGEGRHSGKDVMFTPLAPSPSDAQPSQYISPTQSHTMVCKACILQLFRVMDALRTYGLIRLKVELP